MFRQLNLSNDFENEIGTVRAFANYKGAILCASDKGVFDIAAKVKDSFDVRNIRRGKPYSILRSKDKTNKIQYFIHCILVRS